MSEVPSAGWRAVYAECSVPSRWSAWSGFDSRRRRSQRSGSTRENGRGRDPAQRWCAEATSMTESGDAAQERSEGGQSDVSKTEYEPVEASGPAVEVFVPPTESGRVEVTSYSDPDGEESHITVSLFSETDGGAQLAQTLVLTSEESREIAEQLLAAASEVADGTVPE